MMNEYYSGILDIAQEKTRTLALDAGAKKSAGGVGARLLVSTREMGVISRLLGVCVTLPDVDIGTDILLVNGGVVGGLLLVLGF